MTWRLRILLTALSVLSAWAQEEGALCSNKPISHCTKTCLTIGEQEEFEFCNRDQGIICCPDQPSQHTSLHQSSYVVQRRKLPNLSESDVRKYRHVVALSFLKQTTLDQNIYRCTAVLVRPNLVLTSALCGESPDAYKSPNYARLGIQKPYQGSFEILYDSEDYSNRNYRNDLSLLKLRGNFSNEFVAHICTQPEFDRAQKLVAVGHSQLPGTNCDMFKMEVSLREFSGCANVERNIRVEGIGYRTHFCVNPINPRKAEPGTCVPCLRGSGSVLHAVLPGGGICVAGVATPTSSNCHVSGSRLYYTRLIGAEIANFIGKAN